ncbi:MAG: hypothetical protein JWQ28_3043 [Pedobacter sp.]|nr:hypothetical protein [Pedobacter sp.]
MTGQTDYLLLDRKQILSKAAEGLFAQHGFDRTSIRLIAKELYVNSAKISIPSVFTGNLSSLIHLDKPMKEDISRRMIDHCMSMVVPVPLQSIKLFND